MYTCVPAGASSRHACSNGVSFGGLSWCISHMLPQRLRLASGAVATLALGSKVSVAALAGAEKDSGSGNPWKQKSVGPSVAKYEGIHGGSAGHKLLQWWKQLESSVEQSTGVHDRVLCDDVLQCPQGLGRSSVWRLLQSSAGQAPGKPRHSCVADPVAPALFLPGHLQMPQ